MLLSFPCAVRFPSRWRLVGGWVAFPTCASSRHHSFRVNQTLTRSSNSRQSIKKYVLANNNIAVTSQAAFDSQFNKAIKAGVEKKEFEQPKGKSTARSAASSSVVDATALSLSLSLSRRRSPCRPRFVLVFRN